MIVENSILILDGYANTVERTLNYSQFLKS